MKMFKFLTIKGESGNSMLGLLAVMTISLAVVSGLLGNAASTSKVKAITDDRSNQFYDVEDAIGKVNAWLQDNSAHFIGAFKGSNFNTYFELGEPTPGSNEVSEFMVPTQLKVAGSTNSALLTNDETFGTSSFPTVTSVANGSSFNAASEFAAAFAKPDNVKVNVRAVLVWAVPNGSDYAPIFRIDAITGNNPDRGVHAFAFSEATISRQETVTPTTLFGFYGRDLFQAGGSFLCKAMKFQASGSNWAPLGNGTNGCIAGTDVYFNMQGNGSAIHGQVLSNGTIGNLSNSTRENAVACSGGGCHNFALPSFNTWAAYVASECGGTFTPTKTGNLNTASCYNNVSPSGNVITLNSANSPYYINNLDLTNNAKIRLNLNAEDDVVQLYVANIKNGNTNHTININGNTAINDQKRPMNLVINYLSETNLKINGNSKARAVLNAPLANIQTLGNHTWYGAIRAKSLTVSGNSTFYFDEDITNEEMGVGAMEVTGATFSLRKTSQRYR